MMNGPCVSPAFLPTPPLPLSATPAPWRCSLGPSRRRFLEQLPALALFPVLPALPVRAEKLDKLESALVPVVMCRRVMTPVQRYIEEGAWDKGRTSVNYCTRMLALRTRMRDAAMLLEGDAMYDATEIMGEMANTMSQLDASLYTPLFIPSDDGISVEQKRYQIQAFAFYNDAIRDLDRFMTLVPEDALQRAMTQAQKEKYAIRVEDK